MDDESTPLTDDPEILALLDFEPVPRKCARRNGWTADNQRRFIAGLARHGDVSLAAQSVRLTGRGAYDLRKSPGHEPFFAAWDAAVALFARRAGRAAPSPRTAAALPPDDDEAGWDDLAERILLPYMLKLGQEREARLAGRIVEADYYVRQLTWLEVALDLGDGGVAALKALRRGGEHAGDIVATPMSVLLGDIRRACWAETGEPERPPPGPLGIHDDEISIGPPWWYSQERDGSYQDWCRREDADAATAAEAQAAWEKKARKDAAAWAKRVAGDGDANGTEPQP